MASLNNNYRAYLLNFHGLGEPPVPIPDDERPYWISPSDFDSILCALSDFEDEFKTSIELTFDDGNKSDLELAVPLLKKHNRRAVFYVCGGRIGKTGYLDNADIQALLDAEMEIGSHGMDHVKWNSCSSNDLETEIVTARQKLQDAAKSEILKAAIPFGAYNSNVIKFLKKTNWNAVYSSDGGYTNKNGWFHPRNTITRNKTVKNIRVEMQETLKAPKYIRRNVRIFLKSNLI